MTDLPDLLHQGCYRRYDDADDGGDDPDEDSDNETCAAGHHRRDFAATPPGGRGGKGAMGRGRSRVPFKMWFSGHATSVPLPFAPSSSLLAPSPRAAREDL